MSNDENKFANNSGKRISHPQMVLAFNKIFQTPEDPK
jgi:hypothetical protein